MNNILEMRDIVKKYPGVLALDHVSIDLKAGDVHCLVGENGAGKSTLMKILSGAVRKDSGEIFIDSKKTEYNSPSESQALGINIIYQDFKLVPELSAASNIFLGRELKENFFLNMKEMNIKAAEIISQLGEDIDVTLPVNRLSTAERQMIEIAKAIIGNVKILAMDEPTAPLTSKEINNLFNVIKKLKENGVGIIYISHRLEEIFETGNHVTVLRDGKVVHSADMKDVNKDGLIKFMVGRELANEYPVNNAVKGKEILKLDKLSSDKINDVSFSLHHGEVLGLAGLVGAGRSELVRAVFGADKINSGKIYIDNKEVKINSPKEAIDAGIALLTEDRNLLGLFMNLSIRENISISSLGKLRRGVFINRETETFETKLQFDKLRIKAPSVETSVESLSGGNRQKVVLARWLETNADIFIFDEPTAGIDVGVKFEIYNLINALAEQGKGIIVISSELPELIGISDRIIVMCEGRITGILQRSEVSQEKILNLATKFSSKVKNAG
ncbi:MAG TPA: sugar ABC transporter ATP-binding protein [Ignavibacteriaceae bacterium]|nr:sugar ABC transporter ATP-binding protein [Ignavibacteriaceae bacterium]